MPAACPPFEPNQLIVSPSKVQLAVPVLHAISHVPSGAVEDLVVASQSPESSREGDLPLEMQRDSKITPAMNVDVAEF